MASPTLSPRIVTRLQAAEDKGMTKTELFQTLQVPADQLDLMLKKLLDEFIIVMRVGAKRGLGRPARRFWLKEFAPPILTSTPAGDIPVFDPESPPAPGGVCAQCGQPTSMAFDRALTFCSDDCRQLAKVGGVKVKDLFAQATDARTQVQIAMLLAAIDLRLRGYRVLFSPDLSGATLMAADDQRGIWVTVLMISNAGYFPPMDEYESAVAVYKDGRLKYGGKNPLVVEAEKIEDGKPEMEK